MKNSTQRSADKKTDTIGVCFFMSVDSPRAAEQSEVLAEAAHSHFQWAGSHTPLAEAAAHTAAGMPEDTYRAQYFHEERTAVVAAYIAAAFAEDTADAVDRHTPVAADIVVDTARAAAHTAAASLVAADTAWVAVHIAAGDMRVV